MNANNRRIQHYAGLIQVSTSVFILGDALAMSLMGAWGCDTGVPYICATSSFLAGILALRCSVRPTPTLRRLSHALSFMNLGVIYGFGMVMLGTFGFLLDHKRHSPSTLLSVHMAYTLFGLINIICAIMQVKSVSLRPASCLGDYTPATQPTTMETQAWCTCGLSDYSLVSNHSSHITSDPSSYPSQLHVFCADYSPTFVIDAEMSRETPAPYDYVTSRDLIPCSTPPPPYEEVVSDWDRLPPYQEHVTRSRLHPWTEEAEDAAADDTTNNVTANDRFDNLNNNTPNHQNTTTTSANGRVHLDNSRTTNDAPNGPQHTTDDNMNIVRTTSER